MDLHGRHAAVLLKVLSDKTANPAKNIALAGHYGSGKSSVILGVQEAMDKQKINWVNLSLSSLGIDDATNVRIQHDGAPAPLTNLIQKEIVKQLLYRKAPADMPGSRYSRIDAFKPWRAAGWGAITAVGVFIIAVLLGLVNRVVDMGPQSIVTSHGWVPWAVVATLSAFVGAVWFFGLRAMQSRTGVESVSAGGAAVTLKAKENSYFDEYLDEIVYFFQKTKTTVAVFEDLDRFKDPHIFETLRELNTVLNNSEQIESRPIRFVYAVRDSIFDQLESGESNTGRPDAPRRASALESIPSANRTKFFDLVVPMVPFITHRSARDLLEAEFAEAPQQPSAELMNLVGAHLTDMRLIRNIRNEFEMYRTTVLGESGLEGLTVDRLFAMMVYKNLNLNDFEAIRLGTSNIDAAYQAFREMVKYQSEYQAASSKQALNEIASNALLAERASAAGDRLKTVISIMLQAMWGGGVPVFYLKLQAFELADPTTVGFWKSLYETRAKVRVAPSGYNPIDLSFENLTTLVGDSAAGLEGAFDVDVTHLRRRSRDALEVKDYVAKATMSEVMARTDLVMPNGGEYSNLRDIVSPLVSPLARELLGKGYIDENFTLYCSDYHGIAISVSTMNFVLHCVQADRADHRFRFDGPDSIDAVEKEMGTRFLDGESVFNLQVFDHYLPTRPQLLDKALDKLIVRAASDSSFIDTYLMDGAAKEQLVGILASRWPNVFVHLIETAPGAPESIVALVDVSVRKASREIDYDSSDRVAAFVSEHYAQMQTFVGTTVESSEAADTALLVGRLGAQISELRPLGDSQRTAVVTASLYPITRPNLLAALGEVPGLALDVINAANDNVYEHVLANLDDYLDALPAGEATVDSSGKFVEVLDDLVEAGQATALRPVIERASGSCVVTNLETLNETAWPPVISTGRFAPTVSNVTQYVENLGFSSDLAEQLNIRDLTAAEEVDDEPRFDLAYVLANSDKLNQGSVIRLIGQLELPGKLDPERLTDAGLKAIPALLAADLVPDTAQTYPCVSESPFALKEDYFAASKVLASYICELPLSGADLPQVMRSRRVPAAVKRVIVDDVDFVRGRLTKQGAIEICQWAGKGNTISTRMLVEISRSGAPAEHILPLLEPHLPDIELEILDQILSALGDEYEPLTRTGHHRPKLKEHEGTRALLTELSRRDRVSSFDPIPLRGGIRVNMRR
ncbi:hypothetical protein BKP30_27795 [Rhodococcus erythropolis]|uniref:YobI family P-loop NTPase n=1 Tax=Rhodococcus erythropolis TaxID=1833 RepID=UPI0008A4C3A0|nr:P-loop NTPase fold protein [Rhodococcus erythropolis]OHF24848.1 hypothetical protein BKP30_27795 [Rhodococcus erythropolis]